MLRLSSDRAFALFSTDDGMLAVMPVGDRDKFMTSRDGARGSADAAGGGAAVPPNVQSFRCRPEETHS